MLYDYLRHDFTTMKTGQNMNKHMQLALERASELKQKGTARVSTCDMNTALDLMMKLGDAIIEVGTEQHKKTAKLDR